MTMTGDMYGPAFNLSPKHNMSQHKAAHRNSIKNSNESANYILYPTEMLKGC